MQAFARRPSWSRVTTLPFTTSAHRGHFQEITMLHRTCWLAFTLSLLTILSPSTAFAEPDAGDPDAEVALSEEAVDENIDPDPEEEPLNENSPEQPPRQPKGCTISSARGAWEERPGRWSSLVVPGLVVLGLIRRRRPR
jgi:hypothetical protein